MSNNGRFQFAIGANAILKSTDYGVNWNEINSSLGMAGDWKSIATNDTGQYVIAVSADNKVYTSNDYGITWSKINDVNYGGVKIFSSVAINSTGDIQVLGSRGSNKLYISTNYGQTWSEKGPLKDWISVAMSSTGQYQTALHFTNEIYTSEDYGQTWSLRFTLNVGSFYSIAINANGQYQIASATNGQLYRSLNFGVTWNPIESVRPWGGVDINNSGNLMIACAINPGLNFGFFGRIFISDDGGLTWSPIGPDQFWEDIAINNINLLQ
jgi:photosystem II stability/assembly factor-like uncharacterized protein